jgi:hydroxylamine reductase (hybrid-cluster protein)
MFCYQCEETLNGTGCTKNGVCGKKEDVADLQDDLLYVLKSIAFYNSKARLASSMRQRPMSSSLTGFLQQSQIPISAKQTFSP